ncbi:hypothetical protein [Azohydromonas aeria]|uniref:hypothetical protein n=1 Tax=Azohydromonas aeria TaxID=2590212 RepID=UPI0012FC596E|nr:hypothetical protein [Azohydromonas aeria]
MGFYIPTNSGDLAPPPAYSASLGVPLANTLHPAGAAPEPQPAAADPGETWKPCRDLPTS